MACWLVLAVVAAGELAAQSKPNIILINLDDADGELLSPDNLTVYFPNLRRFADEGIRFTNFHVTTPLCGPSRASLLRGQYAHTTGIRTNGSSGPFASLSNGFNGGMAAYGSMGYHENDISSWMKAAGYRTMMVGKFLHSNSVDIVPSGWDDFHASRGSKYFGTWRFTNRFQPQGQGYANPANVYRTAQESLEVLELIDEHMARDNNQPFFLYCAPFAPHLPTPNTGGMVDPKYQQWWPNALMPLSAAVNEWDFTDKSTAIRHIPALTIGQSNTINQIYRDRLRSVRSVDDMFAALYARLFQYGLQNNTWIFLTSDNGFANGHHRLIGKADCFDQSTHVPTYVIGPGVAAGSQSNHLLAHIDLAPTIGQLAGANVPALVDGKSFVPLLYQPQNFDQRTWRDAIVIENWESRNSYGGVRYNTASVALRMYDSVYSEWADGSQEFYDLANDPHQVNNAYQWLPDEEKQLLAGYMRSLWSVPGPPETTITEPYDPNVLVNKKLPLRGMAEDDSGVSRVRLAIVRFSDWHYWNGVDWQPARVLVNAELTNPGQQLTTWSYSAIPRGQPNNDMIGLWARAYDDSGNFDRSLPVAVFRVDWQRPESWIVSPQPNQIVSRFAAQGGSFDEGGVSFIRMVVRNTDTGQYFDGVQWVDDWTWFYNGTNYDGSWSYANDDLQGNLMLSTRAVDMSGNVQKPPTIIYFRVQ